MSEDKNFPNFDPTKDLSKARQYRSKRGMGAKPILESEIVEVQKKARSAMEAARLLGVAYNTYTKYAKMYGLFDKLKNPTGKGIRKGPNINHGKFKLEDILLGKYPDYPAWKLKRRLIAAGFMVERCNNCGFEEKRVVDDRVPLMLDFLDDDKKNHKYENLRFLCLNCYFLVKGNLTGPTKEYNYYDTDSN